MAIEILQVFRPTYEFNTCTQKHMNTYRIFYKCKGIQFINMNIFSMKIDLLKSIFSISINFILFWDYHVEYIIIRYVLLQTFKIGAILILSDIDPLWTFIAIQILCINIYQPRTLLFLCLLELKWLLYVYRISYIECIRFMKKIL